MDQDSTTKGFKKQLPKNALMKGLAFAGTVSIGVFYVPYLVHRLGVGAYGLIAISALLVQYAGSISDCFSKSVSRFLTIELRKDDGSPGSVFSTSLLIFAVIIIVQIPIFLLAILYSDTIFNIPEELFYDCVILFSCAAIAYGFSVTGGLFSVSAFSENRLDILEGIKLIRVVCRPTLVVCLFYYLGPQLRYIGYVDLCISFVLLLLNIQVWKKLTPNLHLNLRSIDFGLFKPMMGMTFWMIITYVGALIYLKTDIWVVNYFISAEASGLFSALLQWSILLRFAGQTLGMITAPMVLIYQAKGLESKMVKLTCFSVKVLSIALAIPISVIVVYNRELLSLWMGSEYAYLGGVLSIIVAHMIVNVGVAPFFQLQTAKNCVKIPALVTVLTGIVNLISSITVVYVFNFGLLGVVVSEAIVLTAKNTVFTPVYSSKIMGAPLYKFYTPLIAGCVVFLLATTALYLVKPYLTAGPMLEIFIACSISTLICGMLLLLFLLEKDERRHICESLKSVLGKF